MKIYIIGCVPAQISYVEKFYMGRNVLRLFNQPYLQNKGMKLRDFLHVNTNSKILIINLKLMKKRLCWACSKMGVASLVTGLKNWQYLKNE